MAFEAVDVGRFNPSPLDIRGRFHGCEISPEPEQVVLNIFKKVVELPCGFERTAYSDHAVQLVDRPEGLDAQRILGHPLSPE